MSGLYLLSNCLSGIENPNGNVTLPGLGLRQFTFPVMTPTSNPTPKHDSLPLPPPSWSAYQTNQLVDVEALLSVGFENTDKKTAQEVPLLLQGLALILLYVQVYVWGGSSHRASPWGQSPGSRSCSTPGTRSQSVPEEGKGQRSGGRGDPILIPYTTPTRRAPPPRSRGSAQPPPRPTPTWEVLTLLQGQRAAISGEGQECLEQQLGAEVRILQQSLY